MKQYTQWRENKRRRIRTWQIESSTQSGVKYTIRLIDGELSCTCPGFTYHGKCKHLAPVKEILCLEGFEKVKERPMYKFDGQVVADDFEKAFGRKIETLTVEQLWWLTKFAKFVRQRARNNAAFNNYMNRNFQHATFRQVQKSNEDGTTYEGLEIGVKNAS